MKNNQLVMVFAKKPVLGKVKTRLAKTIGDEKALEVYTLLLHRVLYGLDGGDYDSWLFWDSLGDDTLVDNLDISAFNVFEQEGRDLGEKLKHAFLQAFKAYEKVIVIGADCPFVDKSIISEAFDLLDSVDLVVGPAFDGGYYLLGLKQLYVDLFKNIDWGTALVYVQTMDTAKQLGLSYDMLSTLSDIDTEADLAKFL